MTRFQSPDAAFTGMDEPLGNREKRLRLWKRIAMFGGPIVLAGLGLAVLSLQRAGDLTVSAADVRVAGVESRQLTEAAAFVGRVVPLDIVQLTAPEAGRVTQVHVRSGDWVEAGRPIVTLSNPERELAISDRLARIQSEMFATASARTGLSDAESQDRRAYIEALHSRDELAERLRRQEVLLSQGLVNEAYVTPLRDQLAFRERIAAELRATMERNRPARDSQRDSAGTYLGQLRANQAATRDQLDGFVVRAPRAGRILGLDRQTGEAIAVGDTLAQVDPQTGSTIVAQLDAFYAARVARGQGGSIEIGGLPRALEVTHVSPDVREGGFRVEMALRDRQVALNPGQNIQGRIDLSASGTFPSIPVGPYLEQTSGAWIFVVDPDGRTARRRAITTGIRTPDRVAVTAGLQPGERVIVSSYRDFGDARVITLAGGAR
ncbi:efflux RND transporter periplasmic adaptor subunit (plasmid) [Brevundimonas staleyi]|uniref:Efflux RND transporter periplasmic adaptor subunit n=1 Tax=Brevundimonas staleyi TaxID=74326 RepID=A0ABW0FNR3_9CAUL